MGRLQANAIDSATKSAAENSAHPQSDSESELPHLSPGRFLRRRSDHGSLEHLPSEGVSPAVVEAEDKNFGQPSERLSPADVEAEDEDVGQGVRAPTMLSLRPMKPAVTK